tara:strand:- start:1279 stop:2118 length:840 start_codon:yes stop_codon:yes gene_type:complete
MGGGSSKPTKLTCTLVTDENQQFFDAETSITMFCTVVSLRSVFGGVVTHAAALRDWTVEAGAWGGAPNTQIVGDRDWWMLPTSRTSVTRAQTEAWTKMVSGKGWVAASGKLTATELINEIDLAIIATGSVLYTNGFTTVASVAFATSGQPYLFFKDHHIKTCAFDVDACAEIAPSLYHTGVFGMDWPRACFFAVWPDASALAKRHRDSTLKTTPRLSVWTHAPVTVVILFTAMLVLVISGISSYPAPRETAVLTRILRKEGLLSAAQSSLGRRRGAAAK